MMDANQIAVDFQTESDVIRLHLTLFDDESDGEDNRYDHDSDGDEREDREDSDYDARVDEDQGHDSDSDCIRPQKKLKKSSTKRSTGKKTSCIRIQGGLGAAAKATTVIETWHNQVSQSMIDQIVVSTNHYIDKVRPVFARARDAAPTDSAEIKAFIGLLYLVGIHRGSRLSLKDFWDSTGIGIELFRLTMTNRRFRFLMRCLRFDERCIDAEPKDLDALGSIDNILNEFVENCKKSYPMGKAVSLDVVMDARRMTSASYKMMDHQPSKYGIKILTLADSNILYTHNMKVFADNEKNELFSPVDKNLKTIEGLCEPLKECHVRNINVDKRFSKFEVIFKKLVGSSECIAKNLGTVTFYEPNTAEVPPIITLSKTYDVSVTTKRWTLLVFYQILNVAGINSQIIYTGNGNLVKNRRTFLRQLAIALTQEHMTRRGSAASSNNLPNSLQARLLEVTNQTIPTPTPTTETNKRKLCNACLREDKSRKSTKYRCVTCGMYLCLGHVIVMCKGCHAVANYAMTKNLENE